MITVIKGGLLAAAGAKASPLVSLLPMVLVLVFFYFFIIRPQQKREKEVAAMRSALKEGDHIITVGGILGKIVKIKEDVVQIEVGTDKTVIEVLKTSVGTVAKLSDVKNAEVDGI